MSPEWREGKKRGRWSHAPIGNHRAPVVTGCFRGNETSTLNLTEKLWDVLEKPVIQHFFGGDFLPTTVRVNLKYDYKDEAFRWLSLTQL